MGQYYSNGEHVPRNDALALAWFAKAAVKKRKYTNAAWGILEFERGNFAAGEALLRQAVTENDSSGCILIWHYLVAARAGSPEKAIKELNNLRAKPELTKWKNSLIDFHSQKIDSAELLLRTRTAEEKVVEQACDANFHIAQSHLIDERPDLAKPWLEAASKSCRRTTAQQRVTIADLARIAAQ